VKAGSHPFDDPDKERPCLGCIAADATRQFAVNKRRSFWIRSQRDPFRVQHLLLTAVVRLGPHDLIVKRIARRRRAIGGDKSRANDWIAQHRGCKRFQLGPRKRIGDETYGTFHEHEFSNESSTGQPYCDRPQF
jgi:hypothetical protein